MKAPKDSLFFILFGALISAGSDSLLNPLIGTLLSCLAAMALIVFYSEIIARIKKLPATVILMPSAIPLLPGSSIYYTMLYGVHSNTQEFLHYGKLTIFSGLGIALGAIIGSVIIKLIRTYFNK